MTMRKVLRRALQVIAGIWLAVGTVLLLAVGAALLHQAYWKSAKAKQDAVAQKASLEANGNAPWVPEYWDEFTRSQVMRWHSYLYWRRAAFLGKYINIDERGIRKTRNVPADGRRPFRIFMFGGSTMWGSGARDEGTIPSFLVHEANAHGLAIEVTNFGESGYVSTQEVLALMRELQRGNVPDSAIFYSGVNDVFSTLQSGVPGLPQNEFNRVREFNMDAGKVFRNLVGAVGIGRKSVTKASSTPMELAKQSLAIYEANMKIAEAMATSYGFTVHFYWQPSVFTKNRRAPLEESAVKTQAALGEALLATRSLLSTLANRSHFRDLSDVFAGRNDPIFTDFCHTTERGNELVAKAMYPDLAAALSRSTN